MYTPPLFEPNILSTLLRNFSFYFRDGYWGYVFLVIMGLILFPFIWLRAHPAAFSFPDRIYLFNSRSDKMPAVWAFLAFIILCAITYSQEMSLFANFDLMSIGTTVNFAEGKRHRHFRYPVFAFRQCRIELVLCRQPQYVYCQRHGSGRDRSAFVSVLPSV